MTTRTTATSLNSSPHLIHPSLQIKLSQILQGPKSSYIIQSDSVILAQKQSNCVQVYFCDSNFTTITSYLALDNVPTLASVRIKYDPTHSKATIVYCTRTQICFYSGDVPITDDVVDSGIRSSATLSLPFNQCLEVLQISQIFELSNVSINCIFNTSDNKCFLLEYNNIRRQITILDTEIKSFQSKITGLFKTVFKSFGSQNKFYRKCKSFLFNFQNSDNLYVVSLMDQDLYIKLMNLSSQFFRRGQVISNMNISIQQYLRKNQTIIASVFNIRKGKHDRNLICLVILCLEQGKINFHYLLIDLNGKVQKHREISNILQNQQQLNENYSNTVSEPFDEIADGVDIEIYKGSYYIIYFRRKVFFNSFEARNNKLLIVQHYQNNLQISNEQISTRSGSMKLLKLQNQDDNSEQINENNGSVLNKQKLIVLSQSNCWQIPPRRVLDNESDRKMRNVLKKQIPPIPNYDDNQPQNQMGYNLNTDRNSSKYSDRSSMRNQSFKIQNNLSTTNKIQRYVSRKDYKQIFKMLSSQKQKFDSFKHSQPSSAEFPQQVSDQLVLLILVNLFQTQEGLKQELNTNLARQIFTNQLFQKFHLNNKQNFQKFMVDLIQNKYVNSLLVVLNKLLQKRHTESVFKVCTQTIPIFLKKIFEEFYHKQNKSQMIEQPTSYTELDQIKNEIALNYLDIYHKIIMQLLGQNQQQKDSQNNFQSNSRMDQEYNLDSSTEQKLKILLDSLLNVKKMVSTSKLIQNNQLAQKDKSNQIFQAFLQKGYGLGKFLVVMAIKHTNLNLFDFVIRKRLMEKQEILKFIKKQEIQENSQDISRIFINLINSQVKCLKEQESINENRCLQCLSWVPVEYFPKIFEHLTINYPKLAIMYGLTVKTRREIAKNILNIPQLQLFGQIKNPATILQLYGPFYACTQNIELMLNLDLAFLLSHCHCQFLPACKILPQMSGQINFNSSKSSSNQKQKTKNYLKNLNINIVLWQQFLNKIKIYLKSQQIESVKAAFGKK